MTAPERSLWTACREDTWSRNAVGSARIGAGVPAQRLPLSQAVGRLSLVRAILGEQMPAVAQPGFLLASLAHQARLGISRRTVCLVAPPLPVEVRRCVAPATFRWILLVLGTKALERRPRLQQCPIDGEVLLGDESLPFAWRTVAPKNASATSCSRSRSRLWVKLVGLKAGSVMLSPRNHLKSRSYWSRSQNWRSERIE